VDFNFLRSVLRAPKSTPTEMLYLELGCIPFRELIRERRITFLHYILNEDQNSMMYRFLMTQMKNKKPKDWIPSETEFKSKLGRVETNEEIKLKRTLNRLVSEKTLIELVKKKESHSKVQNIKHKALEMQRYLKAGGFKINQEEVQTIFKMRNRVTEVKINFRGKYESFECGLCNKEDESQKHMIECTEILKHKKTNIKPPDYDDLFKGNVKNQLMIAKTFLENMKIKENLKEK
jgi:hypothetical protein